MLKVALASFTQPSIELGYGIKFMRMLILILVFGFGIWGFVIGIAIGIILVATNPTVSDKRGYLYPLFPFNLRDMLRLIVRQKKSDFEA